MRDQVATVTRLAAVTRRAACFSLMATYTVKCAAEHVMESTRMAITHRNSNMADMRDDKRREREAIEEYNVDADYNDMMRAL